MIESSREVRSRISVTDCSDSVHLTTDVKDLREVLRKSVSDSKKVGPYRRFTKIQVEALPQWAG